MSPPPVHKLLGLKTGESIFELEVVMGEMTEITGVADDTSSISEDDFIVKSFVQTLSKDETVEVGWTSLNVLG